MSNYRPPLRDMKFVLEHVVGRELRFEEQRVIVNRAIHPR